MMHRILVGLDGSALAETILPTVTTLAKRLAAEIVLLHVTHVPGAIQVSDLGAALDEVVGQQQRAARAYLDEVVHRVQEAPLGVRSELAVGDAAPEIVGCAERSHVDLIALATHGRSGIGRWLHGSVAEAVLHATTTPLLLLQPGVERAAAPLALQRLVVPLDGSPLAEAALPVAEDLARALGLPIVLLRVVEAVGLAFASDPLSGTFVDQQAVLEVLRDAAREYLDGLAGRIKQRSAGVDVTTEVVIGSAAESITARAREQAGSLLVLTTHGRTGWRAMLLGSVARRVALQAGMPVVVVPSPEARAHAASVRGAATG